MEHTGALSIEAEVLGEGLSDTQLEALLDEIADCPSVVIEIAGSEALVCAVEEREEVFALHDLGEGDPLVAGGVDAGGIVCACVEEDDGAFRSGFESGGEAFKVEAARRRVVVGVVCEREFDIGENLMVVCPGGGGEVDGLVLGAGVEAGEEGGTEMDCSGSGNSLNG